MSGKKTTGRKSTAKSTSRSSAAKTSSRSNGSQSEADKDRKREQKKSDRADRAVAGAKVDEGSGSGFDPVHGRYRDELVETDAQKSNIIVRRTFLASKTEFEVEVPKAIAGKSQREIENLKAGDRVKLYVDAAKSALDARSEGLSKEIDNSDLGGKHIGQPRGGGTFNPENPNAPRPSPGEPGAGSDRGAVRSSSSEEIPRKGQGAPTTTGAPIREPELKGSANDRTGTGNEVTRTEPDDDLDDLDLEDDKK